MSSVRTSFQDHGTNIAVFFRSSRRENVESAFLSWFNWNGTFSNDPTYLIDGPEFLAYIWSNKQKIWNYYYNITEHKFCLRTGLELQERRFQEKISRETQQIFDTLVYEEILHRGAEDVRAEDFTTELEYLRYD